MKRVESRFRSMINLLKSWNEMITHSSYLEKTVSVGGKQYYFVGDREYLGNINDFEPDTIAYLRAFCDPGNTVLDVGANIGFTSLALSDICQAEKVVAIEPIPNAFQCLEKNIVNAGTKNIDIYNFAAGSSEGELTMTFPDYFLAGSFVSDRYQMPSKNHFLVKVPVHSLDQYFDRMHFDFIKIDVEGFELSVLFGLQETLQKSKPHVLLEMNHWCLNVFQRITLPDFWEKVCSIFPYVIALQYPNYIEFNRGNFHSIARAHVIHHQYSNLVAGFDRDDLYRRLSCLQPV